MSDKVFINLGIDFGTRLTKICARSEGIGVAVCDFGGGGTDGAMIGSVLSVTEDGCVYAPEPGKSIDPERTISYLKMALADRGQLGLGGSIGHVEELKSPNAIPALSALFLASTLARARVWVEENWYDDIGGREVDWSGNVGLPVQHCDSLIEKNFQEVLAVAWKWSERPFGAIKFDDLLQRYCHEKAALDASQSPCQAYAEIAAAVQSFATSRSTPPGIYICFDIGGGTLDGVAFNLRHEKGEVSIDFYSGRVAALGVDWIADQTAKKSNGTGLWAEKAANLKAELLQSDAISMLKIFSEFVRPVQKKVIGPVIAEARDLDGRDWRTAKSFQGAHGRDIMPGLQPDETLNPLKVYLCGGGMRSPFYNHTIVETYEVHAHRRHGIPPYRLIQIPSPSDFDLGTVNAEDYHRFLVAHGLSVPVGEGPEIKLPSEIPPIPPPQKTEEDFAPNYADSKDMYD